MIKNIYGKEYNSIEEAVEGELELNSFYERGTVETTATAVRDLRKAFARLCDLLVKKGVLSIDDVEDSVL